MNHPVKLVLSTGVHLFSGPYPAGEVVSLGFPIVGANQNPRQRQELQGAPKFSGLLGPMWDGDCLRYEDQKTYDLLST